MASSKAQESIELDSLLGLQRINRLESSEQLALKVAAGGTFNLADAEGNRVALLLGNDDEDSANAPARWGEYLRGQGWSAVAFRAPGATLTRVLLPLAAPMAPDKAEVLARDLAGRSAADAVTDSVLAVEPGGEVEPGGDIWADRAVAVEREDLDPPSAAAEGGGTADLGEWTVAAFDGDGEPDLSHDQLALDLGKAGWNRDARYCPQLGGWLLWRGQHWEPEPGMKPVAIVRGFVRAKARLLVEWADKRAATLDPKEAAKLRDWARAQAKALRQDSSIAAVERLARSNVKSIATPEQWDSDDFLLGTPGGTVDLRTGELREAQRGDYITRATTVAPEPAGKRPEAWLRFLAEVFPDDPDMPGFLQRLAGYALTGSTREHRFFLFHGSGRNGKGTFLSTLQAIMGDYSKGIPTATLLEARSPQHASPLARLRGARFVRGAELPVGQVWNESLVKQLTGGDTITANLMRQDSFDFTPKFTLIVDGNTKPRIRTTDVAMRARMTLVPFLACFDGKEDRGLPERLKAEAGAILRWAIDGAVAWQREGLGIPAAVAAASREYLDSEDPVRDFLEDETLPEPGCRVAAAAVYSRYQTWAAGQGVQPATQRAFGGMLMERGYDRAKGTGGARQFVGLRLRDTFGPDAGDLL